MGRWGARVSWLVPLVALVVAVGVAAAQQKYSDRFDRVDVDGVLRDEARLDAYLRCALDEGPCAQDAAFLKRVLPEALRTGCARCTERQRAGALRVATALQQRRPKEWARLERKYDPSGDFRRKFLTTGQQG